MRFPHKDEIVPGLIVHYSGQYLVVSICPEDTKHFNITPISDLSLRRSSYTNVDAGTIASNMKVLD